MPTMEEIRLALGKMDKSSEKPLIESSNIINENVNANPFSEKLFAPVEQLENKIQDKDKIIESLKNESIVLKNQVSRVEEEKSTILEELEKSRWLESKVALATKKVYEDKVKSVINENVDSKLIPVLTAVARRKQGNQQLNWGNWLKIPENRYLFQVNEDIAKKIFEDTNTLIGRKRTRGGGASTKFSKYSLTFTGNTAATAQSEYVSTDFNPDTYNLNLGFTVSYWVRADEVGATQFAFGRKHSNSQRFTFGINKTNQIYIGTGANKLTGAWDGGLADNSTGQTAAELFPSLFDDGDLKTGNWLHFVVTYADRDSTSEGGVARIVYLNGELIRTQNVNWSTTGGSTGGMYFGGRNLTTVGYNNGWACGLDEVAIFNTAKDSDWVTSTYNSGTPNDLTEESGLVGYWRFEEGGGTTVKDLSGEGNHGTLTTDDTGLPTWSTDTP